MVCNKGFINNASLQKSKNNLRSLFRKQNHIAGGCIFCVLILQDIQEHAPLMAKQRDDFERAKKSVELLTNQLDTARTVCTCIIPYNLTLLSVGSFYSANVPSSYISCYQIVQTDIYSI